MPIIKSAIKRVRQAETHRSRNAGSKKSLRTSIKAVENAVAAKDAKKVDAALRTAYSELDKSVKKNLLHKKTAARKKSSLSKLASSVLTKPKKTATKKPEPKEAVAKKS